MSRGINKAIIVGNLGKDPETRYTAGGAAITRFSVATSEQWTDKQSGEKQERTEWHRIVMFGRLAEVAGEYLTKGRQVYIEGQIRTSKWQDKEGKDRYTTEIVASEMQMLGGRDDNSPQTPARQHEQQGFRDKPKQEAAPEMGADDFDPDDDIPF